MTRLWGPTLPSVHPSLPRSLPSHCTLFFPPFFFASVSPPLSVSFSSLSRFLPFPVLYFYLILFLWPLVFHLLPSSLVSHPLCFPSFLVLLNSSFFRSFISPYLLPFFFSFFTLCFFKSSNIQQQLCLFSAFPQTFPTCLYSSFPHIDILSRDPPRVFPRHATCPRASLVQVAAVAPHTVSD